MPNNHVEREFHIAVLGRTLEHLGVQMYKRRDVAIAELVANCWDAGASRVSIQVPTPENYNTSISTISIFDDGIGMSDHDVQDAYLVIGRNRRRAGFTHTNGRAVMGRKGIGKLAGFGVAERMTIETWQNGVSTALTLDLSALKQQDGQYGNLPIKGYVGEVATDVVSQTGTRIILRDLKHTTPLDVDRLREALSRRFSRVVLGQMEILVNGEVIGAPNIKLARREPTSGEYTATLSNGSQVSYYYGFSEEVIKSPELRGFTILVRGKTAQSPPYFFGVEATASGQHATRYLTGAIHADFLDDGVDDKSDIISTDRQEIDWDNPQVALLKAWGEELTRRALREWATRKGEETEQKVMQNEALVERINRLDNPSRRQVSKLIQDLGKAEPDPERVDGLADSIVRAYEYRQFHDVVKDLESVSEDPDQLQLALIHLAEWKVLESRAILEIVHGRLEIVDRFHKMIINNAPETASKISKDNMHDLLAGFPWLLNPEWQVLAEEKRISTQLREWAAEDITDADERLRYDFLALSDERQLVILEIKRSDHPVELKELQRLETYKERLSLAKKELYMVLICGGKFNITEGTRKVWDKREDGEIRTWEEIYERTRSYYEHYRAVLRGDIDSPDFPRKQHEVAKTREILLRGQIYRSPQERREGLGAQNVDYLDSTDKE